MTLWLYSLIILSYNTFAADIPLGCTEEENKILLNLPFFTIPPGTKNKYEEQCKMDSYELSSFIKNAKPLDSRLKVKEDKHGIIIEKKNTPVKKFYTTEDFTPYAGISFGESTIKISNEINIYMKKDYGDGLFLLVLKKEDAIYARQIIITDNTLCPLKITLKMDEFFQIPYKNGDLVEGEYEMLLYVLNYNKVKWHIFNLEIE